MFESALCVKYCPIDSTIDCKKNSLFAKKGTCANYLDDKKTSYTKWYISYELFKHCIPQKAC
jgi:hypothetical protein